MAVRSCKAPALPRHRFVVAASISRITDSELFTRSTILPKTDSEALAGALLHWSPRLLSERLAR